MTSTGKEKRLTIHLLAIVNDADESLAASGDDFLTRQCATSALDKAAVSRRFISPVHVQAQRPGRIQIHHRDADLAQSLGARLRRRYSGVDLAFDGSQRVDEEIDRRPVPTPSTSPG